MSYDVNTIPRFKIRQVSRGLEGTERCLADELCDTEPVNQNKSSIPIEPYGENVPQDAFASKAERGRKAGEKLKRRDSEFADEMAYECLRYGSTEPLKHDEVQSIMNTTNIRPLRKALSHGRKTSAAQMDAVLQAEMADAAKNQTYDVTSGGAAWSDQADGRPLRDLHDAKLLVPEVDTLYIGKTDAANLREHPDMLAEVSNYSGGFLGDMQLARKIRDKHPEFQNIVINETVFNNDNPEGLGFSLKYRMPDLTWMGVRRSLKLIDFEERSPRTFDKEDKERDVTLVGFERKVDIQRVTEGGHTDAGLKFVNQN